MIGDAMQKNIRNNQMSQSRAIFLLLSFFFLNLSLCARAEDSNSFIQAPVFTPALDYETIPRIDGCVDERAREIKYHNCRDSKALYIAAMKKARAAGQPLMVIFGFNNCPYCLVLERNIFNKEKPIHGGRVARYFSKKELNAYLEKKEVITIPVLRLHARSDHGLKLADQLGITKMAQERGWHRVWSPFVAMINTETGVMTSESKWEAREDYCDWAAGIATSLEKISILDKGTPYSERRLCPKR